MGKKKGFTLIELLAVLVILATILAISMPKILDTRDGAKRKAFKNDVDEIQGIAQLEYNNTKEARYYTFKDGVQINENGETDKLEFKGDNPSDGYLKIYSNGDVEYYLKNKDRTLCARKEVGDRKGQIVKCENINNKITLDLRLTKSTNSIIVIALPKIGEANAIIDTYYYQLNDGKIITSNKASHLFENLKRTDKNGNLINYKVNVKVCTKKGICESTEMTTPLDDIKKIDHKITSEPDKIPGGWSLTKTITFTYPEIKNINDQNIEKNEISIDGGTTWKIYRESITVDKDTTFIARITDGTNTVSSDVIKLSNFDHEGPNITGVTGNPGKWTNKDVTLTVNAADSKSGLADAAYSFDGGTTWQKGNSKTYKSNANGIVIKVKDKIGNISTYPVIAITKIDKSKPECVWSGDTNVAPNSWIRENRSITLTCESSGGSPCNSRYTAVYSTTKKTDTLSYEVTNDAGTSTTCKREFNIYIDKTKPTKPSLSGTNSNWTNQDLRIKPSSTDNESGINRYEAYYGGAWHKWSSANYNDLDYFSNERNETVKFRAVDNAGNESDEIETTVKIDKTPPVTPTIINPNAGKWSTKDFSLELSSSDSGSGIKHFQYKYTKDKKWEPYANSNKNKFTTTPFSAERNEPVYIQSCDNAGNCSQSSSTQIKIVKNVNVTYEIYYGNEETPTDSNKMIAQNGQIGGTVGKSLAIKNVKLSIDSVPKISGSIVYNGHRQTYGDYNSDVQAGQTMCINCQGKSNYGTGEKRLEQIKIKLTGEVAYYFDVYYRVHIRREGWLGTVSNDQWTGSSGLCKRVEAIEIKVVPKGSEIPKFSNGGSNVVKTKIHYTKGDSNVTNNCPPEQEYVCTKENYSYNGFDTYEGWSVERCKNNHGLCVIGTTSGGNCSCRIYSTKTGSRNVCKWVQKK